MDRIGTYHCHCTVGFSGRLCEIDLDGCDPNPCYNGGSCVNDVDSFHCNCVEGFGGDLCRDNLHSERCLHGGTYISEVSVVGLLDDWTSSVSVEAVLGGQLEMLDYFMVINVRGKLCMFCCSCAK